MQPEAGAIQRRRPIIGQRTAHGHRVATHHAGGGAGLALDRALDLADATHPFLEFLLGMPVRVGNLGRRLTEVMKLAELVRHARQGTLDGPTNGVLAV